MKFIFWENKRGQLDDIFQDGYCKLCVVTPQQDLNVDTVGNNLFIIAVNVCFILHDDYMMTVSAFWWDQS